MEFSHSILKDLSKNALIHVHGQALSSRLPASWLTECHCLHCSSLGESFRSFCNSKSCRPPLCSSMVWIVTLPDLNKRPRRPHHLMKSKHNGLTYVYEPSQCIDIAEISFSLSQRLLYKMTNSRAVFIIPIHVKRPDEAKTLNTLPRYFQIRSLNAFVATLKLCTRKTELVLEVK